MKCQWVLKISQVNSPEKIWRKFGLSACRHHQSDLLDCMRAEKITLQVMLRNESE